MRPKTDVTARAKRLKSAFKASSQSKASCGPKTALCNDNTSNRLTGSIMRPTPDPFRWLTYFCTFTVLAFIFLPLLEMFTQPTFEDLFDALKDKDVVRAIWLSIFTSGMAALISLVLGTPFAYLLARKEFPGQKTIGKRGGSAHHDPPSGHRHSHPQPGRSGPPHRPLSQRRWGSGSWAASPAWWWCSPSWGCPFT